MFGISLSMVKFPMKFEAEAKTPPGISSLWASQAGTLPPISCAIPSEFAGPGGGYSPEDLFSLALLNCLIALFKVYSEKSNISFEELTGKVVLTMDRNTSENVITFTHADVFINIKNSSNPEKARQILDRAVKDCPVSNSIKSGKTFHFTVT